MVESITVGQIASFIGLVVAVGGGIAGIIAWVKKPFQKRDDKMREYIATTIKAEVNPLKTTLEAGLERMDKDIKIVDKEATKNYLVTVLSRIEQGEYVDEIELQRFWEQFEHYESMHGNGYIHQKVEKLKQKGLL